MGVKMEVNEKSTWKSKWNSELNGLLGTAKDLAYHGVTSLFSTT